MSFNRYYGIQPAAISKGGYEGIFAMISRFLVRLVTSSISDGPIASTGSGFLSDNPLSAINLSPRFKQLHKGKFSLRTGSHIKVTNA
jgi:hypothetical protein